MKRLITIGIVALLAGLVLGMPKVNGLEVEKSVLEKKIIKPVWRLFFGAELISLILGIVFVTFLHSIIAFILSALL